MITNEEKQLLLVDLSARLPYGVKILCKGWDSDHGCEFTTVEELVGIDDRFIYTLWRGGRYKHSIQEPCSITDYKPYLRPMSSMTEEELEEFRAFHCVHDLHPYFYPMMCNMPNLTNMFDWLNAHHIDYRGLIPKGLALEAPEDMYD